jgi:transcription initiation factor TFIIIB Brf1 subunit/transcription initiation factor TFIIB
MPREPLADQLADVRTKLQEQEKALADAREEIARMKAILGVVKSVLEQAAE